MDIHLCCPRCPCRFSSAPDASADEVLDRMNGDAPWFALAEGETFEDMVFAALETRGRILCPDCNTRESNPLCNPTEGYIGVNTARRSRQGFLTGWNMSRESHFGITHGKPGKNPPLRADVLEAFLKKATELHSDGRFDEAARFYQHVRDCNPEAWRRPTFTP